MPGDRSHRALRRVRDHHYTDRVQPCWRCGLPINYDAPRASTPDSYSLGHRVSLATGGSLLDPANLAPEHFGCNTSSQDDNDRPLGQPSRDW